MASFCNLNTMINGLCAQAGAAWKIVEADGERLTCITLTDGESNPNELRESIRQLEQSKKALDIQGFSNVTSLAFMFFDTDEWTLSWWEEVSLDLRLLNVQEVSLWMNTPAKNTLKIAAMLTRNTCRKLWLYDMTNSTDAVFPEDMFEDWDLIHSFSNLRVLGLWTPSTLFGNWVYLEEEGESEGDLYEDDVREREEEEGESEGDLYEDGVREGEEEEATKECAEREREWITSFAGSCPNLSSIATIHSGAGLRNTIWPSNHRISVWERKDGSWEMQVLSRDNPNPYQDPHMLN